MRMETVEQQKYEWKKTNTRENMALILCAIVYLSYIILYSISLLDTHTSFAQMKRRLKGDRENARKKTL